MVGFIIYFIFTSEIYFALSDLVDHRQGCQGSSASSLLIPIGVLITLFRLSEGVWPMCLPSADLWSTLVVDIVLLVVMYRLHHLWLFIQRKGFSCIVCFAQVRLCSQNGVDQRDALVEPIGDAEGQHHVTAHVALGVPSEVKPTENGHLQALPVKPANGSLGDDDFISAASKKRRNRRPNQAVVS